MYRRRWRWWVLALAVTLALLLVAGVLTQRYGATFTTAAVGTSPDSVATQRSLASVGTTVPLASVTRPGTATTTRSAAGSSTSTTPASAAIVHPASPTEAVQGYYSAIFTSITDKNSSKLALAYSYLSSQAQAQLPFVQFTQRYAPDTGIEWSWSAASLADAGQSATVPAQVTEHRGGTAVHSSLVWSAVKTPDGWRLLGSIEQTQPAQSDQQGPSPGHPGHGKGRDKGD